MDYMLIETKENKTIQLDDNYNFFSKIKNYLQSKYKSVNNTFKTKIQYNHLKPIIDYCNNLNIELIKDIKKKNIFEITLLAKKIGIIILYDLLIKRVTDIFETENTKDIIKFLELNEIKVEKQSKNKLIDIENQNKKLFF